MYQIISESTGFGRRYDSKHFVCFFSVHSVLVDSFSIWHVVPVPILEIFHLLLGNKGTWGAIFAGTLLESALVLKVE